MRIRHISIIILVLFVSTVATAKIAVFENGKILKIEKFEKRKEAVSLYVSGGGEITVSEKYIRRILPDEIEEDSGGNNRGLESKYGSLISRFSQENDIDKSLIRSVITVESDYNPDAVSVDGAVGLMQILPETATRYGIDNLKDPEQNIKAGTLHLKNLFSRFGEDKLRNVLAAYNAGAKAVERYNGVPPYRETEKYVERIVEMYRGTSTR